MDTKSRRRRKTSKEERVCPVCAQDFKKAEHLARHLRSHTKEKPFNCPVCNKAFARQDTLLRHSRSHATDDICGCPQVQNDPSINGSHASDLNPELNSNDAAFSGIPEVPLGLDAGSLADNIMAPMSPPKSIDKLTPSLSIGDNNTYPAQLTPLPSLFSLETSDAWKNQPSPPPAVWDYRPDRDWETLLTGDDFDLNAVNLSLLYATADYVPTFDTLPDSEVARPTSQPASRTENEHAKGRALTVQKKWHTFSEATPSGQMTPDQSQEGLIDESYRKRLTERLQQRVQHGILPSTPFLDLSIQAYFSKFHPLFPVVHMPTFRPSTQNSVLLLSICSIGSLFVGSPRAINHGISMFERLNKAILASWDTYVANSGCSNLVALQASIIGQTFGLVMGRPKDLYGIEMFHGSVIAWARTSKLFHIQHPEFNLVDMNGDTLEKAWLIVLGIHIHDAALARIHHHEPILRHSVERLPQISSNELFTAPSAGHWKSLMIESQMRTLSLSSPINNHHQNQPVVIGDFALCAILESISALVCEDCDLHSSRPTTVTKCHDLLIQWHHRYHSSMQGKSSWFCLMMLWHSNFILLHTDLNALECACGREGYDSAQKHLPYVQNWLRSMDAKRCLLHAMLIQKNFESLPAGAEPALHVPMCLYYCGLIWSCFMCFSEDADPVTVGATDHLQFAELRLPGVDSVGTFLEQMGGLQPRKLAMGSLFRVIDLLQRISHWKISQSLASTLLALVEETQDLF
ncbi:hypothetical protein N7448_004531 [Penicillium atrosanguineum]|uniref:uncharacterized protein n=1 Tax=Penicillium atrosanguineum TaxID=1132637 RepID=UPI0023837E7C|nr:uncharacterized protein N7443_008284 [Penicillium atrosanguineum]KAJ5135977.1 hypothetical protein N7448_004531 [Penicillium atrosanguineum]KAJ5292331.1 hypothetical protein N7443_008284 [Penicillium atrosanguineum]